MYIINSGDLCLYNILCNSIEILINCFNNFTDSLDFIRNNPY